MLVAAPVVWNEVEPLLAIEIARVPAVEELLQTLRAEFVFLGNGVTGEKSFPF
jgi:hypothetical protein